MKSFIVHKNSKILRTGICSDIDFFRQVMGVGESIMEGTANDATQKVVNGEIVDKTPEEIQAEEIPEIPEGKKLASIIDEQWQDVLKRLNDLEKSNGRS